jgi:hypothetical protein
MSGNFHVFYNTHYSSVGLGVDHHKKCGFIRMADSIDKNLSPNQIQKGQKVYDYDNEFYMNFELSDIVQLLTAIQSGLSGNPVNTSVITDQSKSSWNPKGIKTKVFILTNVDQNGNIRKDKDGNTMFSIVGNMNYLNGEKRNIFYPLNSTDGQIFLSWLRYCQTILPGIGVLLDDLCWFLTGKNADMLKKERSGNNDSGGGYYNQQPQQSYQPKPQQQFTPQQSYPPKPQQPQGGTPFTPPTNNQGGGNQGGTPPNTGGLLF